MYFHASFRSSSISNPTRDFRVCANIPKAVSFNQATVSERRGKAEPALIALSKAFSIFCRSAASREPAANCFFRDYLRGNCCASREVS